MIERVEITEDMRHPTYFQTYLARGLFLLLSLIALINCCEAERSVHGFMLRYEIALFWLLCVGGGVNVWKAYKRRQMTRMNTDLLMMLLGMILVIGSNAFERLI